EVLATAGQLRDKRLDRFFAGCRDDPQELLLSRLTVGQAARERGICIGDDNGASGQVRYQGYLWWSIGRGRGRPIERQRPLLLPHLKIERRPPILSPGPGDGRLIARLRAGA